MPETIPQQLFWIFILALPVACISWTVTKEEIAREPREWLEKRSRTASKWWARKLCYVCTCEYCFSHYVAAGAVAVCNFMLLIPDWRGYFIAWLTLVAVANVYMSAYSRLRVEIKKEKVQVDEISAEKELLRRRGQS